MQASLQFLGGAGTVTGSKFLLECNDRRILIECGLFQGLKELRLKNWQSLSVDPSTIDAVILTHAHLDHCGYIPLLVKHGFKGKIYCSEPTLDLARILLLDSAKIQEEDAILANKMGYSKHEPARPLYTTKDVDRSLHQFSGVGIDEWFPLWNGVRFRFIPSGHIVGSVFVEIEMSGLKVVFSGDLGRHEPLVLHPPRSISYAHYLVVESTYGDRFHEFESPLKSLARIVNETLDRKGHLIIPSFAVGRTQDLLYLFSVLKNEKAIPSNVPIYLDTPMGTEATAVLVNNQKWHRLGKDEIKDLLNVATIVEDHEESKRLADRTEPSIVIAGSGMMTGGRVLNHLAKRLTDERNTVLLVGYQAPGTRGSLLRSGSREIKMQGRYVHVRAQVEEITSLSAHADQKEIINWLQHFHAPPKNTFIVHGEPQAAAALELKIKDTLGWNCVRPHLGERFLLK